MKFGRNPTTVFFSLQPMSHDDFFMAVVSVFVDVNATVEMQMNERNGGIAAGALNG